MGSLKEKVHEKAQRLALVLINDRPEIMSRLVPHTPTHARHRSQRLYRTYHCDPASNVWNLIADEEVVLLISKAFDDLPGLTKSDRMHMYMFDGCTGVRIALLPLLGPDIHPMIDREPCMFAFINCLYDMRIRGFRPIEVLDYVGTTTGWSYDAGLAAKHGPALQAYLQDVMPVQEERDKTLAYLASLLSGTRNSPGFLSIASETYNFDEECGKTTFQRLLHCFFGGYSCLNTHLMCTKNEHLLRGKRLFTQELFRPYKLNFNALRKYTDGADSLSGDGSFPWMAGFLFILNGPGQDHRKLNAVAEDYVGLKGMVATTFRTRFYHNIAPPNLPWSKRMDTSISCSFENWRSAFMDVLIAALPILP